MSGSIKYKDGRVYVYRYELIYLPADFEPLPKQHRPLWSIW